ncbi:MAG: bifunctional folylpolyglutamate synthase/dihydrofolate synthase [bacterium]|nr:bifunctional folylpolyglutamate synthase/dihydrofolate synthase [bacterium]
MSKTSEMSELEWLESRYLWAGQNFTADNPRRLLEVLGNPQNKVASIHVAGTNGKGSVCALIAGMLRSAGKSVGQFASPHLSHITERCIINGLPIAEVDFAASVRRVRDVADKAGIEPSYFEIVTACSFLQFAELGLDWMVVEVGLGGRLDATNIMLRPAATVITTIGYDHTQLLGETLTAIAREKAGIFRGGVPAFVGDVPDEVKCELLRLAQERDLPIEFMGDDFVFDEAGSSLRSIDGEMPLPLEELALVGEHQRHNAMLATRVAQHIGVDELSVERGWQNTRWPGRLEMTSVGLSAEKADDAGKVSVLFDVAHNVDGMNSLVAYLRQTPGLISDEQVIVFLVSVLERKDWRSMLELLRGFAAELPQSRVQFIFTDSGHHSAVAPETLAADFPYAIVESCPSSALQAGLHAAADGGLVVVTGSIYLVGKLRPLVSPGRFATFAG